MKTRIDKTIPVIIMVYGVFFVFLFLVFSNYQQPNISILWICLGVLIVLLGLWKLESYEIIDGKLIKRNFFGLYKKTINLKDSLTHNKKIVNTSHFKNPLNIIKMVFK